MKRSLALLGLLACVAGAQAQSPQPLAASQASPASDCNRPAAQALTQLLVPGHAFMALPSQDGCTIFVSLTSRSGLSQIAVLKRSGGAISLAHAVAAQGQVTGLALSHDGAVLVAANGAGVTLFSTERLMLGADDAALGYLNDGSGAGSIYAALSPDDHLLFVSDERSRSLTVYDFAALAAAKSARMIGQVPTGIAPVGLAFSKDGRYLYSSSEVAPGGERSCAAEGRGARHPPGELTVIDVARAATEPANAVLARVPAGCNPVRVALSAQGEEVYVTNRGSNVLQVFDAARLLSDPAHALARSVAVGESPVGIAVAEGHIFVANSDRFGGGRHQTISVLDAANPAAAPGSIPAGSFPRELKITADGKSLLIANFDSDSVEWVDLARLSELSK